MRSRLLFLAGAGHVPADRPRPGGEPAPDPETGRVFRRWSRRQARPIPRALARSPFLRPLSGSDFPPLEPETKARALLVHFAARQSDAEKANGPAMPRRMGSRSFFCALLKPGPTAGAEFNGAET